MQATDAKPEHAPEHHVKTALLQAGIDAGCTGERTDREHHAGIETLGNMVTIRWNHACTAARSGYY